jgi:tetratricopeptide (TPR) repeat protein
MRKTFSNPLAVFLSSILFVFASTWTADAQRTRTVSSPRGIDDLLAIADVEERIKALEAFLKDSPEGTRAIEAREALVRSWAELGTRELAENRIGPAVGHFQKAVSELPEEVSDKLFDETVARIPFVISGRGYRAEAVTFARDLERRFAKEPMRLGALGEFYLNVEAPRDAIRVLESAVEQRKEEAKLRRPLAAAYRMGLRLDQSAKELEQVAALDEKDTRAFTELGNIARAKGEYDQALRFYRSQLRIDATNAAALKGVALTALARGRESEFDEGLARLKEIKEQKEISSDIHFQTQMAFYYLANGKNEPANLAIVRALTIEPRYSWGRIAAAELDMAEGRIFEAEKHLLAALRTADFPTLRFTLGRLYLAVEDFDGAIEQFGRAFTLTKEAKFSSTLGGVFEAEAATLDELLAPERRASIFIAKSLTSDEQFALAESLVRLDARLKSSSESDKELETLANVFVNAEGTRRAFRALYLAQRLSQSGIALPLAMKYADTALEQAETVTAPDASVPEFPNYDREGRLAIFKGRAFDARGWSLFQLKRNKEAVAALNDSIAAYGSLPEGKQPAWHLAAVKETIGELRAALDLYIAAYEPPSNGSSVDIKRTVIEGIYKKVHGSLAGLDEKLGAAPPSTVAASKQTTEPAATPATTPATTPAVSTAGSAPAEVPPAIESKNESKAKNEELPSTFSNGVIIVPFRSSRLTSRLLRAPFNTANTTAPTPDSIQVQVQVEAARPRRVLPPAPPADPPATRPRRAEKPM